jgi:DNA-binding MarR family transcriptional regulator
MQHPTVVEAIRAFNRFYTNIIGVIDRHILGSPFSLTEVRILLEIFRCPGCNARKIQGTLEVDEGYLSRTIDKLVKQGLIDKCRSENDGRMFVLSLSNKGREVFLELDREAGTAIESMIRHLSADETAELVAHMRRIQEILMRSENRYEGRT